MSEERFNQLETRMDSMQQDITTMKLDISIMKQDMTSMQLNVNALREDMTAMRQRFDSFEGTILLSIREGLSSLGGYLDDLNFDLADNERKTRRLSRRMARLEQRDDR